MHKDMGLVSQVFTEGDLAAMPDGSILVKENLTSADPADLAAITVMQKQGSTWYWARFAPDGSHDVAGTTDEPSAAPCVSSGCHGDMAGSKDDYVFLNNEAQDAAADVIRARQLNRRVGVRGVAREEDAADKEEDAHQEGRVHRSDQELADPEPAGAQEHDAPRRA
jgi:hypothetical protein